MSGSLTMQRIAIFAVVLAGLGLLAGCQNSLKITVQMIEPEGGNQGQEYVPGSSYADAVSDALGALRSYRRVPLAFERTLRELGEPEPDIRTMLGDVVEREQHRADALIPEGTKLLEELGAKGYSAERAARVRDYCARVRLFTEDGARLWTEQADEYQKDRVLRATMKEALDEFRTGADKPGALARAAEAKAAGFGGFTVTGVHKISPGDPMYARVLRGKPVGQPFTAVEAGATGDSTIVFVQEAPTQMRIYRIDMDPRQLIQNVIYISDKALQAAVKYLSPP